jgi:hypothetical protein
MAIPQKGTYSPFYETYISLIEDHDLKRAFTNYTHDLLSLLQQIPAAKVDFSYAPKKWTIKQVLQHVIDTERVFTYRALYIARQDPGTLQSFDENAYAKQADVSHRSWDSLLEEFQYLRIATEGLFINMTPEMLQRSGKTDQFFFDVNSLAYMCLGHSWHHGLIIEERYLSK